MAICNSAYSIIDIIETTVKSHAHHISIISSKLSYTLFMLIFELTILFDT